MIATKTVRQRTRGDVRAMVAAAGIAAALLIGGAGGYALGNLASSNRAIQPANPSVASGSERASSELRATSLNRIHSDGGARDPSSR